MASYANPIFYSEAADSAVQPDVQRRKRSGNKSRDRSRSPLARETMEGETEESKSSEAYEQWKVRCRELFWRVMADLLKRPVTEEQSATPCTLGKTRRNLPSLMCLQGCVHVFFLYLKPLK